jgi:hypothetical protein
MSIQEIEAEALKLPEAERAKLIEHLLASLNATEPTEDEYPIWGLGRNPVDTGVVDGSTNLDHYVYGDLEVNTDMTLRSDSRRQ